MSSTRDQKIDALKCLAIALVIAGHAIVYNSLYSVSSATRVALGSQWIEVATLNSWLLNVAYSVHMPLFAFLSSYVLFGREGRPLQLVRKRAVGLVVPYLAWVVLAYVFISRERLSPSTFSSYVGTRLLYPQSPGAPWFLYALFGCFVIFAAVRAMGGSDRILLASAALAGILIVLPLPTGDLFGVQDVAWLYPFFAMGYLFAEHAESLRRLRRQLMFGGALLWVVLLPVIWPVLVPEVNWWYPNVRELLHAQGLPGAVVLLYAARYLCAAAAICAIFYAADYLRGTFLTVPAWIGRRTLGMYVTQPFIFVLITAYLTKNVMVLGVLTFLIALALTWLFERNRITRLVLLGQPTRARSASVRIALGDE